MTEIELYSDHSLVSEDELSAFADKLQPEIERMNQVASAGYDDDRASINLPVDSELLSGVNRLIEEKQKLKPEYLIVVGIGGSNLGTIAVQEAILGKFYNQFNPAPKVLYADNVDSDLIDGIVRAIEPVLKNGGNVIINGVSKSGSTTETIANFEVLVELLKRYKRNYQESVVFTTDKGSKFWDLALEQDIDVLEVPKRVGGRYSVFSPVGLFPLGLLGIDIEALRAGATSMRSRCLIQDIYKNPAALSAALIYHHYRSDHRNIYNLFLFANDLESVGKWYRQLMGESTGKQYNQSGVEVYEGITPKISIGSTDLHSMAQLYLGGPQDKFTTFVKVKRSNARVTIPDIPEYSRLVEGLQGKTLAEIMDAIYSGVKTAYIKGKRPFSELILPDKSEHSIGQLLQLKMMEKMYLGFLLEVNPFDQPNVEEYKRETRKILELKE